MLRDAIVEVLRGSFDASGCGGAISLVDAGLIRQVIVDGDLVRVELGLAAEWAPFAQSLAGEVRRRVQALPEVTLTEVTVLAAEPTTQETARSEASVPMRRPTL
jgi:metal-sulfur cluster biosynthetic enzyme